MAHIITSNNNLDAWQQACRFLKLNHKSYFNLILEIDNPTDFIDLEVWIFKRNPKDFGSSENILDVINTIFPYKLYERYHFANRNDFFNSYKDIYLKGKRIKTRQSWGTYFQRLLNYSKHFTDLSAANQLENAIVALSGPKTPKNSIVFHLSSSVLDSSNTRLRGAPCWHFGELLCNSSSNTVDLFAVYRNHDYFNKTLGNLIGLSKLLHFICIESGRNPGKLIIHSANAYYDCNNTIINNIIT